MKITGSCGSNRLNLLEKSPAPDWSGQHDVKKDDIGMAMGNHVEPLGRQPAESNLIARALRAAPQRF